jgi:hypothetical protein
MKTTAFSSFDATLLEPFEPGLIGRHKRTHQFTIEDYWLLRRFLGQFRSLVSTPNILTEASSGLEEFGRLGLADASILRLAQGLGDLAVLTDDIHLYLALQKRGLEPLNFNHLREMSWQRE